MYCRWSSKYDIPITNHTSDISRFPDFDDEEDSHAMMTNEIPEVRYITLLSYTIAFVIGLCGNTLVIYIIGRFRQVRRKSVAKLLHLESGVRGRDVRPLAAHVLVGDLRGPMAVRWQRPGQPVVQGGLHRPRYQQAGERVHPGGSEHRPMAGQLPRTRLPADHPSRKDRLQFDLGDLRPHIHPVHDVRRHSHAEHRRGQFIRTGVLLQTQLAEPGGRLGLDLVPAHIRPRLSVDLDPGRLRATVPTTASDIGEERWSGHIVGGPAEQADDPDGPGRRRRLHHLPDSVSYHAVHQSQQDAGRR